MKIDLQALCADAEIVVVADGKALPGTFITERDAIECAENYLQDNPTAVIFYGRGLILAAPKVDPQPAPSPTPAPTPTPVPTPAPTPAPQPLSNAVRINYVDPIDNSSKFYDVSYSRVLFVSANGSGDGSQANPMHPSAIFSNSAPGTAFIFRGGQYTENYGGNWGARNFAFSAAQAGISLVAMPGEIVEFISPDPTQHGNIILAVNGSNADGVTIAGIKMQGGGECVFGGGYGQLDANGVMIKGPKNIAIVGNTFSARYTGNSMTGLVSMQGDDCKIIGNIFQDTGWAQFYNNNHATYIQSGASNILVEANLYRHLQVGHVIQVHQDGVAQNYQNVVIRRNKITADNPMDCRGITVSNVQDISTVLIEENLLDNVGQQFSGFSQYGGQVTLKNNTFQNILGGSVGKIWLSNQYGHNPKLYRQGNIINSGSGADYGADGIPMTNIIDI